jgi:N utilization substance protein A
MASELYNTIDALSREKGIDPQIVVSAVEDAIVVATRKYYKTQETLRAELDKDSGKIRAFAVRTIVETPEQVEDPLLQVTLEDARKLDPNVELGGELQIPKPTEGILGRIAAQLAKQVIFQKVREAERDTVYNEYIGRVGEIINATVKRIEGPDVIFDLGKAESRMPRKEQSRLESFAIGERVRVVIARVEKALLSWSPAPRRNWCSICFRPRFRRFMTGLWSSGRSRGKRVSAPRSRSCPRTRTWTQWARASA